MSAGQGAEKAYNSVFDEVKIILCLMIVALHTNLLRPWLFPWLRLAVPLFFALSGYFFFGGLARVPAEEKGASLRRYIGRNLKLYAFWLIALLPYTLRMRAYFAKGAADGLRRLFKGFFFGSTFIASWFIMALIIGTLIVYALQDKIGLGWLLLITGLLYVIAALWSSYPQLLRSISGMETFMGMYEKWLGSPALSFPAGLFWIAAGKGFAEGEIRLKRGAAAAGSLLGLGLLYAEWVLVREMNGTYKNDVYLALLPACFFIFAFILTLPPACRPETRRFRHMTIMIYAMHGTVADILKGLMGGVPEYAVLKSLLCFAVTLLISVIICLVILRLEKVRGLRWLRYAH